MNKKMKEFFKWLLIVIVFVVGSLAEAILHDIDKFKWSSLVIFIFTLLISVPCVLWWKSYFDNLFDN